MKMTLITTRLLTGSLLLGAASAAFAQEAPTPAEPPDESVAFGFCGQWPSALVDDFEDGDLSVNDGYGGWFAFNDGTALQTPDDGLLLVSPDRPNQSQLAGNSSGGQFSDWGAGFAVTLGCAYDVSDFGGVTFLAQSSTAGSFTAQLPTLGTISLEYGGECLEGCEDHYGHEVSLPDPGWYECTLRFEDLAQVGWGVAIPLDTSSVTGIQFQMDPANTPYDLTVDDVGFSAPGAATGCRRLSAEEREHGCSRGHRGQLRRHLARQRRGSRGHR